MSQSDPDSTFSAVWDLSSILFLGYVSVTVPLRACFDIGVPVMSFGFWFDNLIDFYFLIDVVTKTRNPL